VIDVSNISQDKIHPFVQWVGGKRKIAEQLAEYIPSGLNNYYEPFLGGGALFFQVSHLFKKCFLSDINLDLVTCYNAVKNNPETVNFLLEQHKKMHSREYYYQVRDVNNSNNPDIISARFLYLNRYSFKGIYRINKNGSLDLSFSTKIYRTNRIYDKIKSCSDLLKNATIYANDFSFVPVRKNDFVYLDPPYHKSGEDFYTRLPFDESEQIRLRDFVNMLHKKGVKFIVSNSDTKFIRDIYKGYKINTIEVKYSIRDKKQKIQELVITNY
jgi:DNA adenine methylase